ncbi:MAG: AAA family ATPase [Clostridia bacterium]|nr:AAA family ATPase [Clostridia bacterium]
MKKPHLIVITGRPGAGKTTLAETLSRAWYLPLISRDRIKEGMVHTAGVSHEAMGPDANLAATEAFFDTLGFLLDRGVSVAAEAAFQHPVWEKFLRPLAEKADITVLLCDVNGQTALDRFLARGLADEKRLYFHGDKGVHMAKNGAQPVVGSYNAPHLPYRTITVHTENGYEPDLEALYTAVFG